MLAVSNVVSVDVDGIKFEVERAVKDSNGFDIPKDFQFQYFVTNTESGKRYIYNTSSGLIRPSKRNWGVDKAIDVNQGIRAAKAGIKLLATS